MYALEAGAHVDRILKKLAKSDRNQMEAIARKIEEILEDLHRFKPMHFPLGGMRRAHFGNFVLLFSVDEQRKTITLEDYEHHDRVHRAK
jgi:mRNA-degrading endonuclease RelE of RelBE toxin-antitoxin system